MRRAARHFEAAGEASQAAAMNERLRRAERSPT